MPRGVGYDLRKPAVRKALMKQSGQEIEKNPFAGNKRKKLKKMAKAFS